MEAYPPSTGRKPIQFTIGALLALTTACAFSTCLGRLVFRTIEGRAASAKAANEAFAETMCVLRVPESSDKVDFYARFQSGNASFDVSESEFLAWAKKYPWKLLEFNLSGETPATWGGVEWGWPQDAGRVWYFSNSSHRGGWNVMYDRDRQRAYVAFSPR
jgi:hypothetical protein